MGSGPTLVGGSRGTRSDSTSRRCSDEVRSQKSRASEAGSRLRVARCTPAHALAAAPVDQTKVQLYISGSLEDTLQILENMCYLPRRLSRYARSIRDIFAECSSRSAHLAAASRQFNSCMSVVWCMEAPHDFERRRRVVLLRSGYVARCSARQTLWFDCIWAETPVTSSRVQL